MKIYRRTEFMGLPAGVIYSKGKPCYFNGLFVKDDTTEHNDFYFINLSNYIAEDSQQYIDLFDNMLENSLSVPLDNETIARDGVYDDEELFLVYEKEDLEKLQALVSQALIISQ